MNLVLNDVIIKSPEEIADNFSESDLLKAFDKNHKQLQGWLFEHREDDVRARLEDVQEGDIRGILCALGLDYDDCVMKSCLGKLQIGCKEDGTPVVTVADALARLKQESKRDCGLNALVGFAKSGDVRALGICGKFLLTGEYGVTKDCASGFQLVKIAAEKGDVESKFWYGMCYSESWGCEKDYSKAFKWIGESADAGYSKAQLWCGQYLIYEVDTKESEIEGFGYLKKAADSGESEAMNDLGWCYEYGDGVDMNEEKAYEWYMKSAKSGWRKSWGDVARCCMNFAEAATDDKLFYASTLRLAMFYYDQVIDLVTTKDHEDWLEDYNKLLRIFDGSLVDEETGGYKGDGSSREAVEWYKNAVSAGVLKAKMFLAIHYLKGAGVDQDNEMAFKLFSAAVNDGVEEGLEWLGVCYAAGIGCSQNMDMSKAYFNNAVEKGVLTMEQNNAGEFCFNGLRILIPVKLSPFVCTEFPTASDIIKSWLS